MLKKYDLLKSLKEKNITYRIYDHQPFYTVEDSNEKRGKINGAHTKNLFLKNKKNQYVLLSCEEKSLINLKLFSKSIGVSNLSFAKPEYLKKYLGIKPGSVSPFGLLNDKENIVDFYLDDILEKNFEINFHPLLNTSTITLKTKDFIDFMIENKKKINIFSLSENKLIKVYG
tara:strand:- start:948 stop:1463 length:516 start_codon:yes stop_codon:yes gene_type:complete